MFSVGLLSTVSLLALRDGVCMILRGVTTRTNWPKCHKLRDSVNLQAMARVLVGYQCCKKPWNLQAFFSRSCRICLLEGSSEDDPLIRHGWSQCFLTRWNWSCTDQIGLKNFQKCQKRWIQKCLKSFLVDSCFLTCFQAMSVQGIHWVCPPGVLASLGQFPKMSQPHLQTTARIGNATLGLFIDPKFIQQLFQGQRTSQYCRHSRGILLLPVTG